MDNDDLTTQDIRFLIRAIDVYAAGVVAQGGSRDYSFEDRCDEVKAKLLAMLQRIR